MRRSLARRAGPRPRLVDRAGPIDSMLEEPVGRSRACRPKEDVAVLERHHGVKPRLAGTARVLLPPGVEQRCACQPCVPIKVRAQGTGSNPQMGLAAHRYSFSPAVGRHERQRLEGPQRIAARLLVLEQPLHARDARLIRAEKLPEERPSLLLVEASDRVGEERRELLGAERRVPAGRRRPRGASRGPWMVMPSSATPWTRLYFFGPASREDGSGCSGIWQSIKCSSRQSPGVITQ